MNRYYVIILHTTLIATLHAASSSPLEKRQRTTFSTTSDPITQGPDILFALTGCDAKEDCAKIAFINGKIAAEYSSKLRDIMQAAVTLETHSFMPEKPHDISIDAPSELLCALTAIMNGAYNQKQSEKTVSALELSKKSFIAERMKLIDYEKYKQLFELIHMYNINHVIPDVAAIFALQLLDQEPKTFFCRLDILAAVSPLIKSALAKQLYLSLRNTPEKYCWYNLPYGERFGISVQDIHDNRANPGAALDNDNTKLDISSQFIDDLAGLHSIVRAGETQHLQIQSNQISSIPLDAFRDLTGIITLDLSSNCMTTLIQNMFAGLSDLVELDVSLNNIESIEQNAFAGTAIQTLHLEQNKIKYITPGAFANLRNLRILRLSFNSIGDLAPGVFTNLASLEELSLNGNPIVDFNEKTRIEQEVTAVSPHAKIYW